MEQSISDLTMAAKLRSGDAPVHVTLGQSLLLAGRLNEVRFFRRQRERERERERDDLDLAGRLNDRVRFCAARGSRPGCVRGACEVESPPSSSPSQKKNQMKLATIKHRKLFMRRRLRCCRRLLS